MEEPKVTLNKLVEALRLNQLVGDSESLERWIITPDVNRPGLELVGFFSENELKRVTILGNKELRFIDTMDQETQRQRFVALTDAYTPCIIVSSNRHCPSMLRRVASERNFPLFSSMKTSSNLMVDIIGFLEKQLAPTQSIHGCLLSIYGRGVLITGKSGIGKSEIALELIRKGHILVADDAIEASRIQNRILGKAPELLHGMLELRGVGVIDAIKMFGASSVISEVFIDCIIALDRSDAVNTLERIPLDDQQYQDVLGVQLALIKIPVREGRSAATIIESAVTNFNLSELGYNSNLAFDNKVKEFILKRGAK